MADSRPPRTSPGSRLGIGICLVLVALLCFAASRLVAHSERHAYINDATPPPTYRLNAGKVYQLSSVGGVKALTQAGVIGSGITPTCFASSDGGPDTPITILSTKDDPRDLQLFATFQVPSSGSFHISCQGITEVFVDDADDAGRDYSALFVLLASVIGLLGFAVALSGGYALGTERSEAADGDDADADDADNADGISDDAELEPPPAAEPAVDG